MNAIAVYQLLATRNRSLPDVSVIINLKDVVVDPIRLDRILICAGYFLLKLLLQMGFYAPCPNVIHV